MSKKTPLEELKELLKGEKEEKRSAGTTAEIERIVERMKKTYIQKKKTEKQGKLKSLKNAIQENPMLKIRSPEALLQHNQQFYVLMAKAYFFLKIPMMLNNAIQNNQLSKNLERNIDGANIKLSLEQYIAITGSIATICMIAGIFLGIMIGIINNYPIILIIPLMAIISFVLPFGFALLYPKQIRTQRGKAITRELPFALRHLAVELKAGIGLYKTLKTIALSDYSVLSEEISRTITEIEEGTDTKEALIHLAERNESEGLKKAVVHIVRTLKIGGNLSDIINEAAEDISFALRMEMREFGEKLNFFGIIFIYVAIVMPVFIAILGAMKASPLGPGGRSIINIPLDPPLIAVFYLILLPIMLATTIYYVKVIQPQT